MVKINYKNMLQWVQPYFTKILVAALLLTGYAGDTSAQTVDLAWAKAVGGANADVSNGVATDTAGNVFITGAFNTAANFNAAGSGGALTAVGGDDVFLAKYDHNGGFLWAKSMGGTGTDIGYGVATDVAGNVYITGYFNSATAEFNAGGAGGTLTSAGDYDVFLAKYDPNGVFLWAKSMGGTGADYGRKVATDANGNVSVVGSFVGAANFNPGGTGGAFTSAGSNTNSDIFIARYDPTGAYLWGKGIGGTGVDIGFAVTTDTKGNVFITGTFAATGANFNPGGTGGSLTTLGFEDIFLAKYSPAGTFLWARNMGGTGNDDRGFGVAADLNGNVYITGSFGRTGEFNPPGVIGLVGVIGGTDGFVAKYDSLGSYQWVRGMGGKNADKGNGIAVDTAGSVYVAGEYGEGADFNIGGSGGVMTGGSAHGFVVKYTTTGEFRWVRNLGSPGVDRAFGVAVHTNGSVFITGFFYGTSSSRFNPGNLPSAGDNDAYLVRLKQGCQVYTTFTESACDSFVFLGTTYTATGTYRDTFTASNNCDSIVTLNLTIKGQSSANPVISGHYCDSVSFNGQTYTTSGIYVQRYSNVARCDSNITYDLTIGHSNASSVTQTACDSFSFNGTVYTTGGIYFATLTNESGCDSGVVLNLTIHQTPEASVLRTGDTLTASEGQSYQWIDCDRNNEPVPGAVAQTFTPSESGNYAAIVTNGSCSDTSECQRVEVEVGINELGAGNKVQLYPNPAGNTVTLQTERALNNATIGIVNTAGQILQQQPAKKGAIFTLNMSGYASGIYFVEISEGANRVRMKLLKNEE